MNPAHSHLVLVLDDDPAVRTSLGRLLHSRGYSAQLYANPDDMFRAGQPAAAACLLLDQQLDGTTTGVDVHADMLRRGWTLPTVFLTAHWDVRLVVKAMRAGADGFLTKPYDPEELVREIDKALAHSRARISSDHSRSELQARAATLTPRERTIVAMVAAGLLNKEIAERLDLALVTVKLHRGRAMRKLGAGNAADLARLAALGGIDAQP